MIACTQMSKIVQFYMNQFIFIKFLKMQFNRNFSYEMPIFKLNDYSHCQLTKWLNILVTFCDASSKWILLTPPRPVPLPLSHGAFFNIFSSKSTVSILKYAFFSNYYHGRHFDRQSKEESVAESCDKFVPVFSSSIKHKTAIFTLGNARAIVEFMPLIFTITASIR